MLGINVRLWGVVASLGVLAIVAGATIGVLTLLGVTFQGKGEAQVGDGSQLVEGRLGTANRDRLAICVDSVGLDAAAADTAKLNVEEALVVAADLPNWSDAALGSMATVVDVGCPSSPAALQPGTVLTPTGRGFAVNPFPVVVEASYYRIFTFVVSDEQSANTFGKEFPKVTEEYLRQGDDFAGVTSGLYVTPSQLADTDFLAQSISSLLGFQQRPTLSEP
ncbi:MAG: hypothetical protein IH957_05530 [Chloroflexi bacterium]|nr:hypothetical protein [Chloroflexota bacterium]